MLVEPCKAWIQTFDHVLQYVFDTLTTCSKPRKFVVHCSAGVGRTGYFFACLLMRFGYNL